MLAAIVSSGSLLLDASKALPRPISLSGRNFNDSLIKIQQSPITRLHLKKDEKMMVIFQASASLLFYSYASISVSFMLPFIRLYGNRQSYNKLNAARRLFNPITCLINARWRHQMKTLSALLATCAGNSPITGELPAQRPVTRSFDAFFDVRLSKQPWGWWFDTPSCPLWRHCNGSCIIKPVIPVMINENKCNLFLHILKQISRQRVNAENTWVMKWYCNLGANCIICDIIIVGYWY